MSKNRHDSEEIEESDSDSSIEIKVSTRSYVSKVEKKVSEPDTRKRDLDNNLPLRRDDEEEDDRHRYSDYRDRSRHRRDYYDRRMRNNEGERRRDSERGDRGRDFDHYRRRDDDERRNDEDRRTRDDRRDRRGRDHQDEESRPDNSRGSDQSLKAGKDNSDSSNKEESAPGKKPEELLTSKTGGAYIPPAKLRMMQEKITDKSSVAYQRMSWEALKKSINGLINKVNISNLPEIVTELFKENIVRGRGLLARSMIQAQAASPTFTHVYASLVAVINSKFPQNGELILRRLILMFRRGYRRNDKALCLSTTRFIAHLVNQQVAHEVLALEVLTLLLESPTDDSVEVAIGFLKECGQKLTEVSPRGINSIFERLRNVLHEGQLDVRVQYMVEVMFAIRKDGFKDHPCVLPDLDLVEEEDQFTHLLQLEEAVSGDEMLNVFREDPSFLENEAKYEELKKEILEDASSDEESGGSSEADSSDDDEEDGENAENAEQQAIIDKTETNLVALRRTIYLTVQSSLDVNECAHKMLKMNLKPGQEVELCNMILDCCAQLRTYEKFFGLLGQRFCQIDRKYIEPFQQIFVDQYDTIHRLETNKLRNVAKFFAHLLHTDAISWGVLSVIKLTEEDTTSASRIFLKILFQELAEYMGLFKLNERLKDPTLSPFFAGIMPRDNPKNTRFSINFFTTIGLGGLTDELRDHLKETAKKQVVEQKEEEEKSSSSESSSSSSDSSDSESSSESEEELQPKKKSRKETQPKKKSREEYQPDKTSRDDCQLEKNSREEYQPKKKRREEYQPERASRDEYQHKKKSREEYLLEKNSREEHQAKKKSRTDYQSEKNSREEYQQKRKNQEKSQPEENGREEYQRKKKSREEYQPEKNSREEYETEKNSREEYQPKKKSRRKS